MAEYRRWPWPRTHYGKVVDRLNAAGVRSIAFDVDFSAASDPGSDQAFADALARSEAEIILPTFSQWATFAETDAGEYGERRMLDALPIPILREHVMLGSVSMFADKDGMVRTMPLGTVTQGVPRPSLAAQIAKQSGEVGEVFPVNLALDPSTIPRHSFAAVEDGKFDAADLHGKDILIGATAVELFDRYPVPGHGVIPGAVLQAMAAETLYAGTPTIIGYKIPLLFAAIFALYILLSRIYRRAAVSTGIGMVLFATAPTALWALFHTDLVVTPAIALIILAATFQVVRIAYAHHNEAKLVDHESGLPNRLCLEKSLENNHKRMLVTAMIGEFDALRAVVGQRDLAALFTRIVDRLKISGCDGIIYRIDDRCLAWLPGLELYELEDQLTGLHAIMRSPLEVAGKRVDVTLSFGIADSDTIDGATHAANVATYKNDIWRYHEDAQSEALAQQISLLGELDEGVESGQMQVFYQPKLDLVDNRIASGEALVRWEHPTRGFLRPDVFIPLAEENDRITDLTLFVLRRTIEDLSAWCARGLVIGAAVNISAKLITSKPFVERARALLTRSGVPRDRLTFEVTESAELEDLEGAREGLLEFRELGVTISMDDYGTGRSSLSYLKKLPLSELKIDRSFVQFAHTNSGDAMLVRSTVHLAHELGLRVVAEGVEDEECLAFLKSIQCDYAQGYLIGKPMTAADLAALVEKKIKFAA